MAWEVLQARGTHRVVWGTRGPQWSFHDSKGYIDAVQSRNPGSSLRSDDLLRACRGCCPRGSVRLSTCTHTGSALSWTPYWTLPTGKPRNRLPGPAPW